MAIITISRQPGSLGEELAARVAGHLGFMLVDKVRIAQLWRERDLDEAGLNSVDEGIPCKKCMSNPETEASLRMVPQIISELAREHDLVIIGRGAQGLFRNRPGTLHVRVVADRQFRARQLQMREGLTKSEARRRIKDLEKQSSHYIRFLYKLNWADPCLYDMTLRMDRLSIEHALELIVTAFHEMRLIETPRSKIVNDFPLTGTASGGRFANAAEREFARFLDFYGIPYKYESRTFPLESNDEGKITEAFTPDFYLPEQDLYIELTTMKQSLVTRKNRKVRKLKRLYPDINIRIFYKRDFSSLLAKYGLLTSKPDKAAGAALNNIAHPNLPTVGAERTERRSSS